MRQRIRNLVVSTFAFDAIQSPTFGDVLYNLPLILAFNVLAQALLLAKDEGLISSSGTQLEDLMDGAKTAISWLDWHYLRDGIQLRNEVSQNSKLFGDLLCLRYIAHIEEQLIAWGIIAPGEPVLPSPNISFEYGFKNKLGSRL